MNKIYNIALLTISSLMLAGCGAGGAAGFLASGAGSAGAAAGGAAAGGAAAIGGAAATIGGSAATAVANPEPSSVLLFASGLVGMAFYAKTRLNAKNKKV